MKRGLFVGIDKYDNGITQLQCAVNDAQQLSFAFAGAGYEVDLLSNGQCDSITITKKIVSMMEDLKAGDIFIFYFSGHGRELDNKHYLACVNSYPQENMYDADAFPVSRLVALTNRVPGLNRLFILDCCRSNILAGKDGSYICSSERDISLNFLVVPDKDPGILPPLILNSCSTGERSFENLHTRHGYFTCKLLELIKDPSIKTFDDFQKKLKISGTPKPQHVSWNGNYDRWNEIPLFDHWGDENKYSGPSSPKKYPVGKTVTTVPQQKMSNQQNKKQNKKQNKTIHLKYVSFDNKNFYDLKYNLEKDLSMFNPGSSKFKKKYNELCDKYGPYKNENPSAQVFFELRVISAELRILFLLRDIDTLENRKMCIGINRKDKYQELKRKFDMAYANKDYESAIEFLEKQKIMLDDRVIRATLVIITCIAALLTIFVPFWLKVILIIVIVFLIIILFNLLTD